MTDLDLAAAALGLPAALLGPVTVPALRSRYGVRLVVTALLAAYAVAPAFPGWRAWLVAAAVVGIAALSPRRVPKVADTDLVAQADLAARATATAAAPVLGTPIRPADPPAPPPADLPAAPSPTVPVPRAAAEARTLPPSGRSRRPLALAAAGVLVLVGGVALLDPGRAWDAAQAALVDRATAAVLFGGVLAVFVGGTVVAWMLVPFTTIIRREGGATIGLVNAGRYIGWMERFVLYAFLVAGHPEAAAFSLAAKSVARFPTLSAHQEGFAEYYLIGTLGSLSAATVFAVVTRLALGLTLF